MSQVEAHCMAQVVNHRQRIDDAPLMDDSLRQVAFKDYLDLLFSYKSDSIIQIDTTVAYKINFVTAHAFNFAQDLHDSLYADSLRIICVSNPTKIQDSIIQLTFLDTDTSFIRHTTLLNGNSIQLPVFTFNKLNPNTGKPYNGNASFHLDAEGANVISFNSCQYLIIAETRFQPDNRGSMPPGIDVTYFLEIKK